MFSFQNPVAFLQLLLIPLLYLLRYLKIFKKITFGAVLADWEGKSFTWNGKFRKFLSVLARIFIILSFSFGVAALADPVVSTQEKVYTNLGTDIMFVVDTSPSMAAKDVDGDTRLAAAKNSIRSIIKSHDGYRYGAVALGSNAAVLVPPTNDLSTFEKRLGELTIGYMGNGTAIGDGVSTAVCHLAASNAPKKCIILLTDGENNAGEIHPDTAAALAKRNNITLYIVGIGSKGTVPIEYTDPISGKLYSGYLDSNFDGTSLRKLSESASGRYFETRSIAELGATLETVAQTENVTQSFIYRTGKKHYYKQFILMAIILIMLTWILKRLVLKEKPNFHFKKLLIIRSILLGFAFIMMILAYHDFSWGTYMVPVQKTGTAVSFVFDISNSMKVDDCPGNNTRLEAASMYSKKLLSKMDGTSVSVVLAKGDGVAAIPLTEDHSMIESLIEVLNPGLMTVPGTSLGKGIIKARETFPKNYSSAGRIWVFTDGEETDGQLTNALVDCVKNGIPVSIVGFGSEEFSNALAGDGETVIQTALRTKEIREAISAAEKKIPFYKNQNLIQFINSTERGSALKLLSQLDDGKSQIISYEAKPVSHYKLFLVLALLAFAFGFITTEFNFSHIVEDVKNQRRRRRSAAGALCIFSIFFTGCTETSSVLNGTISFRQKQYRSAVSYFLDVVEKSEGTDDINSYAYALYDLGTAYQMLGEDEAAMKRFAQIPDEAPANVKYAAFYNAGVISQKKSNFDDAQNFFRKALEIDNTKIDAKINMELSLQKTLEDGKQNQASTNQINENKEEVPDIDKALFKHIKENDQKQWKNSETSQNQNLSSDY